MGVLIFLVLLGAVPFGFKACGSNDSPNAAAQAKAGGGADAPAQTVEGDGDELADPPAIVPPTLELNRVVKDGAVFLLSAAISNTGEVPLKDFEITCTHSAQSGTKIDANRRTIYVRVEPGQTRRVRNFNMGFIDPQAVRTACVITDFSAAW